MVRNSESEPQKDLAKTYDAFKNYEGRRYTGMRVGGHHKWYYDKGVWKETKVAPDRWQINFAVVKRRAGKAPEGSGAAVGTEYHWYILTHQHVRKLDANSYTTAMTGLKYMLAYKKAATGRWSASDRAQRRKLAKILRAAAEELERQDAEPAAAAEKRGGRPVAPKARRPGGLRGARSRPMIPG